MEVVTIHIAILCLTALVILYSDHQAFLYMTGKKPLLEKKTTMRLHTIVWVGLLGMISTGLFMAWPGLSGLLSYPGFLVKMGFVATLFVNAVFIGFLMDIAFVKPFKELTLGQKIPLLLSGGVSTLGWVGAATTALIIF